MIVVFRNLKRYIYIQFIREWRWDRYKTISGSQWWVIFLLLFI